MKFWFVTIIHQNLNYNFRGPTGYICYDFLLDLLSFCLAGPYFGQQAHKHFFCHLFNLCYNDKSIQCGLQSNWIQPLLACAWVTTDGVWNDNWIYLTLLHPTHDCTSEIILTHTPVSTFKSSIVTAWQRQVFSFHWVLELSLCLSHSNSWPTHWLHCASSTTLHSLTEYPVSTVDSNLRNN
jgi:hypothetical protein